MPHIIPKLFAVVVSVVRIVANNSPETIDSKKIKRNIRDLATRPSDLVAADAGAAFPFWQHPVRPVVASRAEMRQAFKSCPSWFLPRLLACVLLVALVGGTPGWKHGMLLDIQSIHSLAQACIEKADHPQHALACIRGGHVGESSTMAAQTAETSKTAGVTQKRETVSASQRGKTARESALAAKKRGSQTVGAVPIRNLIKAYSERLNTMGGAHAHFNISEVALNDGQMKYARESIKTAIKGVRGAFRKA